MTFKTRACLLLLAAGTLATACGGVDDEYSGPLSLGGGDASESKADDKKKAKPQASSAVLDLGPVIYTDDDFAELDIQNRDPFRSYAQAFKAQAAAPAQRRVLLPSTSLDEMRLIAIVTGIATAT